MKPIISVIVPVYNSASFLDKCIQSILNQSFQDFELLLINDGSKDNSGAICDRYAQKDKRVKVFHQANAGVSSARNLGISKAKGEYISFIDADDWIEKSYLNNLMDNSHEDLIISNYKLIYIDKVVNNKRFKIPKLIKDKYLEPRDIFIDDELILNNTPFSKLFKTKIIEKYQLKFNEKLNNGEDFIFVLEYGLKCNSILFKNSFDYCYNKMNQSSATTSYFKNYYYSLKSTKDAYFNIISQYGDITEEEKSYQYFRVASKAIFEEGKLKNSFFNQYGIIKNILNKTEIQLYIKSSPRKKSNESQFFNLLQILMKYKQTLLINILITAYYKFKNA